MRLCTIAALLLSAGVAMAQDFPGADTMQSSKPAKSMVTFLFPEQVSIPAQKSTPVDLHFHVAEGLHINSHTPRMKTLIPTNLAVVEQDGLKVSAVDFPPGTDY